jgi:hypothetical protein
MMSKGDKRQIDSLNDYIDNDAEAASQVDAATQRTVDALRQQAAQVEPSARFVDNLSTRLQAEAAGRRPDSRAGLFFRLLPRALGIGAAIAAVLLLAIWLPSLWQTAPEPALPIATPEAPLIFPAAPAELPLYQAQLAAVPTTDEAALAGAREFGLTNPQVFRDPRDAQTIQVVAEDGRQLTLSAYPGGIHYSSGVNRAGATGEPLPVEEASAVAVAFLAELNLLPDVYQISESPEGEPSAENPVRNIVVLPELDGYPVHGSTPFASLWIGPDGTVWHAAFNLASFTPGNAVPIMSAEQAYQAFTSGARAAFRTETRHLSQETAVRYFTPPPPQHEAGQQVTISGWPSFLVSADGQEVRATLTTLTGVSYQLVSDGLAQMAEAVGFEQLQVEGTIVGGGDEGRPWRLAVNAWEVRPSSAFQPDCLIGTIAREGEVTWLEATADPSGAAQRYRLPDAPAELQSGDRVEACLYERPADGEVAAWFSITSPPASEQRGGAAPGTVSVVTEVEVAREISDAPVAAYPGPETAVTQVEVVREVVEELGAYPGPSAGASGSSVTAVVASPIMDDSPYELGETVVITGLIEALVRVRGTERHLEVTLVQFSHDGNGPALSFPLIGDEALLEQLVAERYRLHARLTGVIVPAPEGRWGMEGQAIEAQSYEALWPEEELVGFLGSVSIETRDGETIAIFTDHTTNQQYAIAQPFYTDESNPALQAEQIWLVGALYPGQIKAGLPMLRVDSTQHGDNVARATSPDDFTVQTTPPVIDESHRGPDPSNPDSFVIERMELSYFFELQYDHSQPAVLGAPSALSAEQVARPAWIFYGRSADGRQRFVSYMWATE